MCMQPSLTVSRRGINDRRLSLLENILLKVFTWFLACGDLSESFSFKARHFVVSSVCCSDNAHFEPLLIVLESSQLNSCADKHIHSTLQKWFGCLKSPVHLSPFFIVFSASGDRLQEDNVGLTGLWDAANQRFQLDVRKKSAFLLFVLSCCVARIFFFSDFLHISEN